MRRCSSNCWYVMEEVFEILLIFHEFYDIKSKSWFSSLVIIPFSDKFSRTTREILKIYTVNLRWESRNFSKALLTPYIIKKSEQQNEKGLKWNEARLYQHVIKFSINFQSICSTPPRLSLPVYYSSFFSFALPFLFSVAILRY